jgi:hypothetical protein
MAAYGKKSIVSHFDKLVFVAFLAFFVVSAHNLVTSPPRGRVDLPPMPPEKLGTVAAVQKEHVLLGLFSDPLLLDARHDITTDPTKVEPGPGEVQCPDCGWIFPEELTGCPRCEPSTITVIERPPDPPADGSPFQTLRTASKDVDVHFKGFYRRPGKGFGEASQAGEYVLQINWANNTRTSMIPLGGLFQGYRLYPLEERTVSSSLGPTTRHFLGMTKEGTETVFVEEGKAVRESLQSATLRVLGGDWKVVHGGKTVSLRPTTFDVYYDDVLTEIGGDNREFRVVEITDSQVIFQDKEGETHAAVATSSQEVALSATSDGVWGSVR